MAAGATIKHKSKAGTFTSGELVSGEVGVNTSANRLEFSTNGTNIVTSPPTADALTTARTIDGQSFDGSSNITVIAPGTNAATSKATPVDADALPLVDSAASNTLKKLTWANLKSTLNTYFSGIFAAIAGSGTQSFTALNIKLGTGDDTTITRSAAGRIAVEGSNVYQVGVTVPITDGGTGATSQAAARSNLGLAIGSAVQAYDTELAALATTTSAADKIPYYTGSGTASTTDFTSTARSLVDDTSTAAMRVTLGVDGRTAVADTNVTATASDVVIAYSSLTAARVVTLPAANAVNAGRRLWVTDDSGSCSATNTITVQRAGSDTVNGGTTVVLNTAYASAIFTSDGTSKWNTDIRGIARGGTGATTAAGARTNLGLVIGADVQAYSQDLAALASAPSNTNKLPYYTGDGTAATTDFTATARTLLDDTSTSAMRTTLGLAIGSDVQAYDADLNTIAGLTATTDSFLQAKSSAWAARTINQVKADLGVDYTSVNRVLIKRALGSSVVAETVELERVAATITLTDNRIELQAIWLPMSATLTGVKWYQAIQGTYTGDNENRIGLYTYDGAGTINLVASTTNDANLWKVATQGFGTKAFSSTYAASAGLYFIGLLYNNDGTGSITNPQLVAGNSAYVAGAGAFEYTNSAKAMGFKTSQNTLPSSVAMNTVNTLGIPIWLALY